MQSTARSPTFNYFHEGTEQPPATPSVAIMHFDLRLLLDDERIAQKRDAALADQTQQR